jgi:outer membrane protein assembly factor BamB
MRTQALRVVLLAVVAGGGLVAAGVPAAASPFVGVAVAPRVRLSPRSGPPTATVRVSGAGFGAFRAVDIYFDTTDEALASTNGSGAFSGIRVRVPASALPGTHYITVVQRHSGRSAQARFLVNTNWAQFRYSASRSGFNSYENVLSASDVAGMGLDWSFQTLGGSAFSSPAVANGVVYIGSESHNVYALNAATGAKLWTFRTKRLFIDSSPAVAEGVVYFGSDDNNVYALSAATGAKLWAFRTKSIVDSSPAVAKNVVYIGSNDGNLYALNATTGAKLWTFPIGIAVASSPAVANGVVYIGSDDDNVYALNAATGAKLWTFTAGDSIESSPAVANGVVYVGSDDHNMYALGAATGAKLWTFTTGGYIDSSPAVANGVVYVGCSDRHVYAFHRLGGHAAINRPTPRQLDPNYMLQPQNGKKL